MRKLIPILLVATIFTSCATLLRKDTKQVVTFTTNPPSATVIVDGKNCRDITNYGHIRKLLNPMIYNIN